jgi:hypothetical protein
VRPTLEERETFLSVFNKFTQDRGDSSSEEHEETRNKILNDSGGDIKVGDKIMVVEGELLGVIGKIESFEEGGDQVVF